MRNIKVSLSNASSCGGGLYNKGTVYATKTTFCDNYAKYGGGIYNTGLIVMNNCTYNKNNAKEIGGAIYSNGKIEIYDNNFTYNKNSSVYLDSNKNIIKNSIFTGNTGINGGAIYNNGILTLNKTYFSNNSATQTGGSIYNKNTVNSTNNTFVNNSALKNGGSIYTINNIKIENCSFKSNTANCGAAIYNTVSLSVINSKFQQNTAKTHGGAIYSILKSVKTINIQNSEFIENTANLGGAIYAYDYTKLNVSYSVFSSNKNNAIYTKTINTTNTIYNSSFIKNNSTRNGGAIFNHGSTVEITKTIFNSNGNTDGGAIYNYIGKITVNNSIFINNLKVDLHNCKGKIIANYNWWGSNKKPTSARQYNSTVDNWIYFSLNAPTNSTNKNISITFSTNNIYNGSKVSNYTSNLPTMNLSYSISGCGVNTNNSINLKGAYTTNIKFEKTGNTTITAYIYNQQITSKINIYNEPTSDKITSLFVQIGASVSSSSVSDWVKAGVTDVYVQTRASTNNTTKLKEVISLCKNTKIRVHAWVICFSTSSGFDISTTQQTMVKNFISKVIKISGVSGVCLDYVRYSGTNPSIVNASKITNFVKAVNTIVKGYNKNMYVSACVFAEKAGTKTYYGQDYAAMSPYVDVMLPMAYKYDYNAGRTWLKEVTEYVVKQAKYSKVVTVLQTYKESGSSYTKLSQSELEEDAKAVMSAGSYGYSLFRYGLISSYPTSADKLTS